MSALDAVKEPVKQAPAFQGGEKKVISESTIFDELGVARVWG